MNYVCLMVVTLLISGAAWAAEPCAWVLWVESNTISSSGVKTFGRIMTPASAYPAHSYQQCVEDARTRAARDLELFKPMPHVKRVERTHLMGDQESVTLEMKYGETTYTKYMCFPHPVKPE
jgi:hypothetical protein